MKMNKNLIASLTLFGEMYNSEEKLTISQILGRFIVTALKESSKYSFTSLEAKTLLKSNFGFVIPEAVIKTAIKSFFKDNYSLTHHVFSVHKEFIDSFNNVEIELEQITRKQEGLILKINAFVNKKLKGRQISIDETRKQISFLLLDNGGDQKIIEFIGAFLVENENDEDVSRILISIKEGLIVYSGIIYSTEINHLGKWSEPLTIFLSTEHLFNCLGYNGQLYLDIFNDLLNLVEEINKGQSIPIIKLKYFEETKDEVASFFQTAEEVKRGRAKLDPAKTAMKAIVDLSSTPYDVQTLYAKFQVDLKKKGIEYFSSLQIIPEYNVYDSITLETIESSYRDKSKYDESQTINTLNIFSRINSIRRGNNNFPFEKIKYIYLTENRFVNRLANSTIVRIERNNVPYSKDIDYLISKFWFQLNKGFTNEQELPVSFSFINKAKIVLSSHLNSSISRRFDQLNEDFLSGKLSREQAVIQNDLIKSRCRLPEDIDTEFIEDALDFLSDEEFNTRVLREHERQQQELKDIAIQNRELQEKLDWYFEREEQEENKRKTNERQNEARNNADIKWIEFRHLERKKVLYMLRVLMLTFLPITLGILLKSIPILAKWMDTLGTGQFALIGLLILITLIELFARSYIFDKTKVKEGMIWFQIWLKGGIIDKENEMKRNWIDEFLKEK